MIVDDDISAEIEHQVQSTAQLLLVFVSQLASQLVCMPGHPEHGPFYLVKALLQVLDEHEWDKGTITKAQINLRIVALLAAISQQKFIYGIPDSTTRAGRCLHLAIVCAAGSLTHSLTTTICVSLIVWSVVEQNDLLYGGDPDYQEELQGMVDKLLQECLNTLGELKQNTDAAVR